MSETSQRVEAAWLAQSTEEEFYFAMFQEPALLRRSTLPNCTRERLRRSTLSICIFVQQLGRLKKVVVQDSEAVGRRNYQKGDVINYLDGDSISSVTYGYGISSLISDKSRVIKGGSWNDMPYWLSPGARRYMEQDQSSSTVGFRCAMTRLGSPEGNGLKEGNIFGKRKQNKKKRA